MDPLFEFVMLVKAGHRVLERQINEAMRPLGLTGPQAEAITVIGEAEPLSLSELGGLLIAEAGHPSRLVDRLVAAGLVGRRAADDDRRRIELSLTAQGRRVEKQVRALREQMLEAGREVAGERDLEPVLDALRELVDGSLYAPVVARRRELGRSPMSSQ
jgi:MarR family transcriptional regulator, organic hydroperoxide resistance regulator